MTIQDYERLSEIYKKLDKPEKSTHYKRLAEKLKKKGRTDSYEV